jgi:hypothetical protein
LEGRSRTVPALQARSPVLCIYQSRRPLRLDFTDHRADDLPAYLVQWSLKMHGFGVYPRDELQA